MGLLDDAIREHLDLKRQHGGDPSEIERQEREAFGPGGRRAAAEEADAGPATAEAPAAAPAEESVADREPDSDFEPEGPNDPDGRAEPDEPDEPQDTISVPFDAETDEDLAPGKEEDPWLVEETADPEPEPEQEEDVLEETPEFLQETPEHDRLWFEQKPPRDFDWDK